VRRLLRAAAGVQGLGCAPQKIARSGSPSATAPTLQLITLRFQSASRRDSIETVFVMKATENRFRDGAVAIRNPALF